MQNLTLSKIPLYGLLVGLCLGLAGCAQWVPSFYTPEVRQGNYLDASKIAQLQLGMTKQQVQFIMGTPMLSDIFQRNRWDYIAFEDQQGKVAKERRLTVWFADNRLIRIQRPQPVSK